MLDLEEQHVKNSTLIVAAVLAVIGTWAIGQNRGVMATDASKIIKSAPKQRVEVGLVRWGRDLAAAQKASKESGKPIVVLFQEVPGCAGCQKFGREVLSQPLIVDAIQNEFIPVLVYNNRSSGTDAQLLKRFKEPAWNYQVLRFLDSDAKDIIPRKDQVWTVTAVSNRLAEALSAAKRPTPKYLQSLVDSTSKRSQNLAAFAMHCFWTGEYELGKIDGVTATEAGWLDGREVTLVRYDASKLSLESLAQQAAKVRCAEKMYTPNGKSIGRLAAGKLDKSYRTASASDQKKQLGSWPALRSIPAINATQLTKLNAIGPRDQAAALAWLSPSQRGWLMERK